MSNFRDYAKPQQRIQVLVKQVMKKYNLTWKESCTKVAETLYMSTRTIETYFYNGFRTRAIDWHYLRLCYLALLDRDIGRYIPQKK